LASHPPLVIEKEMVAMGHVSQAAFALNFTGDYDTVRSSDDGDLDNHIPAAVEPSMWLFAPSGFSNSCPRDQPTPVESEAATNVILNQLGIRTLIEADNLPPLNFPECMPLLADGSRIPRPTSGVDNRTTHQTARLQAWARSIIGIALGVAATGESRLVLGVDKGLVSVEALSFMIPVEHTAVQVVHALKADHVTSEGAAPLEERSVPVYELTYDKGQP
jgi:hypothetical protein